MSSAIVNKIQPINYQEQQETLAEVGAKAAMRCGLALGSKTVSWWCHYMGGKSNVGSTAKNRALKFVCWSHIFRFLKCEQAFVSAWLLCFLYYLHLLYKSRKHWVNTDWITFPKLQVVGVGFPLCSTNSFHYCIATTWHTVDCNMGELFNNLLHNQWSMHEQ